jgi:hypothetical protein
MAVAKVYMRGKENGALCVVSWTGSDTYAALREGKTLWVFPCESERVAELHGLTFLGRFEFLYELTEKLRECGGYRILGIRFLDPREAIEKILGGS